MLIHEELRLSDQQKRFCEEYFVDFDLKKAYLRAGYKSGDPEKLFKSEDVQKYIEHLRTEIGDRVRLRLENVLFEQMKIAFSDIRHICEWEGTSVRLKDVEDIDPIHSAAIAEVHETKDGIRVKMHDKYRALENLQKFLVAPKKADKGKEGRKFNLNFLLTDPKSLAMVEKLTSKLLEIPEMTGDQMKKITEVVE